MTGVTAMPPFSPVQMMQMSIQTTMGLIEVQRLMMVRAMELGLWWMPKTPAPVAKKRNRSKT
ncbi:MAG: hypothetical protein V4804_05225 [Pseudomonadota bacterium]|jgi:hypothetical protein